uniref:ER membrane protein complex subunit 1 n=1 Tax=Anthurium amnicola TaxID=1678845 RepID=A0A1D1Z7X7_9ARAE
MAVGAMFLLRLSITLLLCFEVSVALYEDQVGVADWYQQYIGKVKHAVFHTQKAGRKRVVVATEENVIASIDLRRGELFWRHVLGDNDPVDQIDIALGKYVVTLSSGSILRAWNLPDGQMVWESVLQVSATSKSILFVPTSIKIDKDNLMVVYAGGWLYAVSSAEGEVIWKKELMADSLVIQQIFQPPGSDISAIRFVGSSHLDMYQLSCRNGDVLKHKSASFPGGFSRGAFSISNDMLVALDSTRSILVIISLEWGEISFHQTYISDLVQEFSGTAAILPLKFTGMFVLEIDSFLIVIRVKSGWELEIIAKIGSPASISDALLLTERQQAFAIAQHEESKLHLTVKLGNDLNSEVVTESIEMDRQRGHVQNVFLNNYVRTDRSYGFRALIVMEDHSLLLVQQGEIVWSREDGLASIVASTTSELPIEKAGVSVAKVEENIFEWIKGHMLKLKGTLMLASPDDLVAIQRMRLRSSEKTKMTRDHNGFRKLLVVLTRAGKIFALHTGDGRIVWSLLLSSFRGSDSCQHPTAVGVYQWQVPHHHAMDENPSVLVVGRCGLHSDAPGVISIVDSFSGKEVKSAKLSHSIVQVMPLPFTDSTEQRLHLIMDANRKAHLYPRTPESINIFLRELPNMYWYTIEAGQDVKGYSFLGNCVNNAQDDYCFGTRELWSIIFPSDSEKISATATRKLNEVVHTQAKVVGNQDVMYKYISKNMLFVATVSPRAAGEIGSATPEEASLVAYLIDTVTGRIMHRVTHLGAQGPIHAVVSENWVVYHYFNLRAHRYEMSVIEVYDQSRTDNKSIWKLVLGKHNLTSPVSAYSQPEIVAKSQTYFFTHSMRAMAVTSTAKGITSKQLLIGTIGDQVLALDKRYLDPRRTADPSPSEREEGIIPLTDSLPIIPLSYVTHSLQVEGLRGIVTVPAKLESTTLVFAYGVDLFFTRIAPSRTYDSLTEDFSYALLLITIVALIAAIFVTWALSENKELREKWR